MSASARQGGHKKRVENVCFVVQYSTKQRVLGLCRTSFTLATPDAGRCLGQDLKLCAHVRRTDHRHRTSHSRRHFSGRPASPRVAACVPLVGPRTMARRPEMKGVEFVIFAGLASPPFVAPSRPVCPGL